MTPDVQDDFWISDMYVFDLINPIHYVISNLSSNIRWELMGLNKYHLE